MHSCCLSTLTIFFLAVVYKCKRHRDRQLRNYYKFVHASLPQMGNTLENSIRQPSKMMHVDSLWESQKAQAHTSFINTSTSKEVTFLLQPSLFLDRDSASIHFTFFFFFSMLSKVFKNCQIFANLICSPCYLLISLKKDEI